MTDALFPAAQAQPGPDTHEKFVSDLFFYLNALQEAGTIKIQYPYSLDKDTVESHYLKRLSQGEFDDIRDLFLRVMDITDPPALHTLWDRLECLSDQWDAALVCKVEPDIEFGPHRTRGIVQTYFELDGNLVPGEIAFKGTLKQCQNVLYGLEAGELSMRGLRDREPGFTPPKPHFLYKVEVDTDGQFFVQAFLVTKQAEFLPGPVLFSGGEDVCFDLSEDLNCGILVQDDFFTASEARESCYTTKDGAALVALVGPDKEVYLGRRDHYDGHGHYRNDEKSLIHISDTYRVFNLISGHDTPYSYDELHGTRMFSEKEFARFMDLQLEGTKQPRDHTRGTFSQPETRKRVEKKSVLAKLSVPLPRREHKKSAPKKSAERDR